MIYSTVLVSLMLNPLRIIWLNTGTENVASEQLCDIWKFSCLVHPVTSLSLRKSCWNNSRSFNPPSRAIFSESSIILKVLPWILSNSSTFLLKCAPQLNMVLQLKKTVAQSRSITSHVFHLSVLSQYHVCLYCSNSSSNLPWTTALLKNYHKIPSLCSW